MRPKSKKRLRREAPWDEDRIAALAKLISRLTSLSSQDCVVVEGPKDARSMRRLGVKARVIAFRSGRDPSRLQAGRREGRRGSVIVLLPDFDREGRKKIRTLRRLFAGRGSVDSATWKRLAALLRGEGIGIEGVSGLAQKLGLLRGEMWLGPDERVS